jgi:3'-5' exoribonuclease
MGPSSLQGHHNDWNGNFRHSVEVAEHAAMLGNRCPRANPALLVAAALLHDAAKADEYRYDRTRSRFNLSERGELIGHRDTLIEWLAVARAMARVTIANELYLSLIHVINATRAPSWVGLRDPRCIEAEILSMADRLSGQDDVHRQCVPEDGSSGFGRYHPQMKHRSYVTPMSRVEKGYRS